MLTAIIDVRPHPMALTATLSPLVRGVVEGLVGTAILVARRRDAEIDAIADAAGCRVLTADTWPEGFARAVTNAPGVGVLVLDTGIQLGADFWPTLADSLPAIGGRPAASRSPAPNGLASALRAALVGGLGAFRGRVGRDRALLLPPARAREIAQAKADPFAVPFGKSLVRLQAGVSRVALD